MVFCNITLLGLSSALILIKHNTYYFYEFVMSDYTLIYPSKLLLLYCAIIYPFRYRPVVRFRDVDLGTEFEQRGLVPTASVVNRLFLYCLFLVERSSENCFIFCFDCESFALFVNFCFVIVGR